MSCERVERDQLVLRDSLVLQQYPIHFAGAALLMRNDSDQDSVLTVQESADGNTYGMVLVSTPTASGLASVTIHRQSFLVILFASGQKYVRLALTARNEAGIYASMVQYPPKAREVSAYA